MPNGKNTIGEEDNFYRLTKKPGRPKIASMTTRGQRIRDRREELGLKLEDAAPACGLSAAALSRIETGRRTRSSFDTLAAIARALGMDLADLAENDAPESEAVAD